jgi:hypothetical protein
VNLDEGLKGWVLEMRASMQTLREHYSQSAPIAFPKDQGEALAYLMRESELSARVVDRAVWSFSVKRRWPELSSVEYFFLDLRVTAACRTIDGILSGTFTNPDIIEAISGDNPNFTEWILTEAWEGWGEAYLDWFACSLFKR